MPAVGLAVGSGRGRRELPSSCTLGLSAAHPFGGECVCSRSVCTPSPAFTAPPFGMTTSQHCPFQSNPSRGLLPLNLRGPHGPSLIPCARGRLCASVSVAGGPHAAVAHTSLGVPPRLGCVLRAKGAQGAVGKLVLGTCVSLSWAFSCPPSSCPGRCRQGE